MGSTFIGGTYAGGGGFTVAQFEQGGFGSLILNGNVEFEGFTGTSPYDVINASQEVEILPDTNFGTVFADGTNESVTINAPYIRIGTATLTISQNQIEGDGPSYVGFSTSTGSVTASPTAGLGSPTATGSATISLNATDLIDVNYLSMQGFDSTTLSVPTGDIRGGGLFYAAGHD